MRRQYVPAGIYLAFAVLLWAGFVIGYQQVGAQALANVGLIFAVLPLALIDIIVNALFVHGDLILNWSNLFHKVGLPEGYLLDNGYYYFPRVVLMTWLISLRGRGRPAS